MGEGWEGVAAFVMRWNLTPPGLAGKAAFGQQQFDLR
jgi:hypothetical protein